MYPLLYTFGINVERFLDTLPYMGMGMLGIFIVTAIIICSVFLLNFFTKPRKKNDENK